MLKEVRLVDDSWESARARAELGGWQHLEARGERFLRGLERPDKALLRLSENFSSVLGWRMLATILERATRGHSPGDGFSISFLSVFRDFSPSTAPWLRISTIDDGGCLITIGSSVNRNQPQIRAQLEAMGWRAPTNKYHAGYFWSLKPGWCVTHALDVALTGLSHLDWISELDHLHIRGAALDKDDNLRPLLSQHKGDFTYYRFIPPPGINPMIQGALLDDSPLTGHTRSTLSAEERASFIARWSNSIPGVHDWTDNMIEEALFHGG